MTRLHPLILVLAAGLALPAAAQSLKPGETLSSVAVAPIAAPRPVLGADGRTHLAYEIMVTNVSHLFVTLDKVESVDPAGAVLATLEGDRLAAMTTIWDGEGPTIAPGGSAAVFLDVALPEGATLPDTVLSRLTISRQLAGKDGKPAPFPASEPLPATVSFTGAPVTPGPAALAIDSPLKGPGWVAANGCCDALTSHRGAVMAVNGALRVPERFAIDWIQLDAEGRLFTGDASRVESYPYYGTPIHAAADGVVVNLYDEAEVQIPGAEPQGITAENIGGNMLVTDIGGGAYAFYAHLQKGSLKVGLGDRVKAGDVIALLGNTGNTSAPHLHFHVMDGPSPLDAQGLPFVLREFTVEGTLPDDAMDKIPAGEVVPAGPQNAGAKANALPLNDEVVNFAPAG